MVVNVRLFALAKQKAGRDVLAIELTDGASVADLRKALVQQSPELAPLVPNLMIAVDTHYASDDLRITESSEIAAIPPVSGG